MGGDDTVSDLVGIVLAQLHFGILWRIKLRWVEL